MKFAITFIAAVAVLLAFQGCNKDQTPAEAINLSECPDTIKFSTQIKPMVDTWCSACHGVGGSNTPTLSNHANISANADNMLLSIKAEGGKVLMPDGGPALHDSLIKQFSCWVAQGKANN